MQYTEVLFRCAPDSEVVTDILSAMLGGIGFESFVKDGEGLRAYVPHLYFNQKQVNKLIADFPVSAEIHYTFRLLEDKNWNEEWEKNYFRPILIDNQCCIHSSFHKPEGSFQYEIMIDPKMAFGTDITNNSVDAAGDFGDGDDAEARTGYGMRHRCAGYSCCHERSRIRYCH